MAPAALLSHAAWHVATHVAWHVVRHVVRHVARCIACCMCQGAGHLVPTYKPHFALTMITKFLSGECPRSARQPLPRSSRDRRLLHEACRPCLPAACSMFLDGATLNSHRRGIPQAMVSHATWYPARLCITRDYPIPHGMVSCTHRPYSV
jgi:hypothetical protein